MFSFDKMLLCFILAYVIVFLLEIGHVIIKIKFFSMKPLDGDIFNDVFKKNKVWRPLYTFIIFSIFGYGYNESIFEYGLLSCLICGLIWLFLAITFDYLLRILLKSPCNFSFDEYYNDKYLFVILNYGLLLISPFIGLLFCR